MRDVVKTMSDIHNSSNKIADITAVINSIAFQTNILALNAAVEAARAESRGAVSRWSPVKCVACLNAVPRRRKISSN
jgi:hypothetical protein